MYCYLTHTDHKRVYTDNKVDNFTCDIPEVDKGDLEIALRRIDISFARKTSTELDIGILSEACEESLYKGERRRILGRVFVPKNLKSFSLQYINPAYLELKSRKSIDIQLDKTDSAVVKELYISAHIKNKVS